MLTPSFISKELLGKVELTTTDLENEILNLGLNIKSHGVIDKDTDKLNLLVQDERDFLLDKIRENLIDRPLHEKVEVFWSNLNKYSIICEIEFVIQNLDNIFDEDWDFWIIDKDKKWIIESYHEEELAIFVMS
ncbi:hypothetical protein I5515_05215 [Acinetobacter calcoaceticus]|uniref:hypothetical protein n=1 Tax=Acinetobacter calcoaceticus TaxID=471 RepID=UPI0002EED283|nr:hypothetical protein [Acinetobacter calcoaceticus]MBJ9721196.1 hypothetical protein [Acinetobacter calcoaceticus]